MNASTMLDLAIFVAGFICGAGAIIIYAIATTANDVTSGADDNDGDEPKGAAAL